MTIQPLFDDEMPQKQAENTVLPPQINSLAAMPASEQALVPVTQTAKSIQPTQSFQPSQSLSQVDLEKLPKDTDIDNLMSQNSGSYASITDKILAQHKTSELGGTMSAGITKLVMTSKGFNPSNMKHGLLDKVIGFARNEREQMLSHMQSVQTQVNEIVASLDKMAALQQQRIGDLTNLMQENFNAYKDYKVKNETSDIWIADLNSTLSIPADPNDDFALPKINELRRRKKRLEVAKEDFENSILLCKQSAIELQMMQDNARGILELYTRSKNNVIPALKRALNNALIQLEQKDAVSADMNVRDVLAEAMKENAKLLGENSVQIAKMTEKSVIDVDTIQECQKTLDDTITQIRAIEESGRQDRIADAAKRQAIEQDMINWVKH